MEKAEVLQREMGCIIFQIYIDYCTPNSPLKLQLFLRNSLVIFTQKPRTCATFSFKFMSDAGCDSH